MTGSKPKPLSALDTLNAKFHADKAPAVDRPKRKTFEEFLLKDARVPSEDLKRKGAYDPFTFKGRELLLWVVRKIDEVLGEDPEEGGAPLSDSTIVLQGGARLGKTVLEGNLAGFCSTQRWLNVGLFLPDDGLAETIVDTKFRPDVLDQIGWLNEMATIGRIVSNSGKQVNRKGAVQFTDGIRRANFIVSGLQKIPTSLDIDITCEDEKDDIPEKNAAYLEGRTSHSKHRIKFIIGTARISGRGQQFEWEQCSRAVGLIGPFTDRAVRAAHPVSTEVPEVPEGWVHPEEHFPQIIRCQMGQRPSPADPKLTWAADFRRDHDPETIVARHDFDREYYLAHPQTGEPLDRFYPIVHLRAPERARLRKNSLRTGQIGLGAISLVKIVNDFTKAVEKGGASMERFRCDVLGLPKSLTQALDKEVLDRAEDVDPYTIRREVFLGRSSYAGLDVGSTCHLWVRERESANRKRLIFPASYSGRAVAQRVVELFHQRLFSALFVDAGPELDLARGLVFTLNGLSAVERWPAAPDGADRKKFISLPGGLTWNGNTETWTGLRAAMVRFTQNKPGQGIVHSADSFPDADGVVKFVPVIQWNRDEAIDHVVREFLTPEEGVEDISGGCVRLEPAMLLPQLASAPEVLEDLRGQLMRGSEREVEDDGKPGGYKKNISNHYLLADAYSAIAEMVCSFAPAGGPVGSNIAMRPHDRAGRTMQRNVGTML